MKLKRVRLKSESHPRGVSPIAGVTVHQLFPQAANHVTGLNDHVTEIYIRDATPPPDYEHSRLDDVTNIKNEPSSRLKSTTNDNEAGLRSERGGAKKKRCSFLGGSGTADTGKLSSPGDHGWEEGVKEGKGEGDGEDGGGECKCKWKRRAMNGCTGSACMWGEDEEEEEGDEEVGCRGEKKGCFSFTAATVRCFEDRIRSFFQPSENKLAMKLYGNKNALDKEKCRQRSTTSWIIHPCSDFRFYWDLFMLILLIVNLIILPVAISFFNDDLSPRWVVFNSVSDSLFILDLIINFRTGIIADNHADEVILDPKQIAIRYLKTWFFLDFVSSLPLDYIILLFSPEANVTQLLHAGRALRIFRLVKLLSLVRLLRLSRLVRYFNEWQEFLSVAGMFMRIFNLICMMLLIGHWNGCLQYLVPMLQDFPANSWVAINELQRAHWSEQYTWALFKALSHMLCIGYGRYPPQSTTDVWLTMISMLSGASCYALFVGHSTTLIQSFDTSKRLYREKFKQVEEYMTYRKLPRNLRQRITDYYEHRFHGKMFDERNILGELNECLKEEIVNFNCRALVGSVPFFAEADPSFVSDVVTKLEYEVFQPGDYIIREGTVGHKMYFIQEGVVDIVTKDGNVPVSLSEGSYFGEICLLNNTKRVASVRAETYCSLFSLSVNHFKSVLANYPAMRHTMERVAETRLHEIGQRSPAPPTRDTTTDYTSDDDDGAASTSPDATSRRARRGRKGRRNSGGDVEFCEGGVVGDGERGGRRRREEEGRGRKGRRRRGRRDGGEEVAGVGVGGEGGGRGGGGEGGAGRVGEGGGGGGGEVDGEEGRVSEWRGGERKSEELIRTEGVTLNVQNLGKTGNTGEAGKSRREGNMTTYGGRASGPASSHPGCASGVLTSHMWGDGKKRRQLVSSLSESDKGVIHPASTSPDMDKQTNKNTAHEPSVHELTNQSMPTAHVTPVNERKDRTIKPEVHSSNQWRIRELVTSSLYGDNLYLEELGGRERVGNGEGGVGWTRGEGTGWGGGTRGEGGGWGGGRTVKKSSRSSSSPFLRFNSFSDAVTNAAAAADQMLFEHIDVNEKEPDRKTSDRGSRREKRLLSRAGSTAGRF